MFSYLWLLCRRAAVLIPGLIIAFLSTRTVLPYFKARIPLPLAIFITYVIVAYGFIPGVIRIWHYFRRPKHLSLYCITPDGFASDPINIGIIGSRRGLIAAMETAGWHVALPITVRTILLTIGASLINKPFPGMPMSLLYLFGRKQDIGFEMQVKSRKRGERHHVRFWATTIDTVEDIAIQLSRGHGQPHHLTSGQQLWIGAASRDIGLALIQQNFQLTHFVDSDTNAEREYMVSKLVAAGSAEHITTIQLHQGFQLLNRAWFASLHSDGKMALLRLKKRSGLRP